MSSFSSQAVRQRCPNCQREHDVSVYVSGQKYQCACGIRFEVVRSDVSAAALVFPNVSMTTPSPRRVDDPPPPPGPAANAPSVPGYDLLELLGRGGMGEVWRARQLSLNRMVAVKVLPEKLTGDPEFVARFEKEATALAQLSHPNIVQIIDRGMANGRCYFAMELVAGRSLRATIEARRLELSEVYRYGAQLCRAIDYAHQQQVIHRDLKPENVLVDPSGALKVADFGLAGIRGGPLNFDITASSVAMGTVNYMAPEQRRDAKKVDHRADIYALGVMLYELVTGELPLGRFPKPSERTPSVDAEVERTILAMLSSDPYARPPRAIEVAQVLEVAAGELETQSGSSLRRHAGLESPRLWRIGLVAAIALLATLGVAGWIARDKSTAASASGPLDAVGPPGYGDTEGELMSSGSVEAGVLRVDFDPGDAVVVNAHAGLWRLDDGALSAVQWGGPTETTDHPLLVPRAYVSQQYYSADDFRASVDLQLEDLPPQFPALAADSQRYGEIAFRIKDLQVSIFAIPDVGLRLMWRYFSKEGVEVTGNSARDSEAFVGDEVLIPPGRFTLELRLKRVKQDAVDVSATVNGQQFARRTLPGLAGQVGKVALGCRNLSCRFDDLSVSGKKAPRPSTPQ